jgi:hypothetical protein
MTTEKTGDVLEILFTSFRDSMTRDGLKVSMCKHAPKMSAHPTLSYLIMPDTERVSKDTLEKICSHIMDNNRDLVNDFLGSIYDLGIRRLIICCWCTGTQIEHGKLCVARTVGDYIGSQIALELDFPIEIKYADGREKLK